MKKFAVTIAVGVIVLLSSNQISRATTLLFDQGGFAPIDQTYGDNVAATPQLGFTYLNTGGFTPNVVLSYANTSWGTAGGIPGVTYPTTGQTNGTTWSYTFTADAGYYVHLTSIDYGHLSNPTYPTVSYSVTGGTPAVFTGSITPNTALTSPQTLNLGGVIGSNLTLTFKVTTQREDGNDGLGFDNLVFTQSIVPEPASQTLLLIGGAYLLSKKRRCRTKAC